MIEVFYLFYFFVFFLGTIFGSFLNVFVAELEPNVFKGFEKEWGIKKTNKTFWARINRRSACPKCEHVLTPYELFPIFSFLFQGGRCKNCKEKISPRYLFVEVFSGMLFVGFFYFLINKNFGMVSNNLLVEFVSLIPILSSIILIFLFDLKHKIIPDLVLIPLFFYSIFYLIFFNYIDLSLFGVGEILLNSILFSLPFWALWFFSKGRAMGFADWKLIFVLSLFFLEPLQNLLFIFMSFWIGAIYAIPALFLKKKYNLSSEVPFGPFIISSFILVYIFNISYYSIFNIF